MRSTTARPRGYNDLLRRNTLTRRPSTADRRPRRTDRVASPPPRQRNYAQSETRVRVSATPHRKLKIIDNADDVFCPSGISEISLRKLASPFAKLLSRVTFHAFVGVGRVGKKLRVSSL